MLFTELKKIQDNDIEQTLAEKLEARGIDPSILQQELGGTEVTVEQLISEVVEGLIAQAAGKSVGRPSRKSPESFRQVQQMYETHEISGTQAAALLGVARGTFYRWLKEAQEGVQQAP